ncbi:DUF4349 domain-containing protein [Salipaludibacillus keqinensis]|uniref:DUF4349 domain-containing protein n=1 Tax=Salipaludibacillus keqinensis TaxID=2045207 RepID=UPI001304E5FD|nr:DUF4349 domain-containing protein [Salipaludibacillus keqinensis]
MILKKRTFAKLSLLLFLSLFTLFACSNQSEDNSSPEMMDASNNSNDAGFTEAEEYDDADMDVTREEEGTDADPSSTTQMVIYNGDVTIEVNDYDQAQSRIQDEVDRLGGFTVESSMYQEGEDEQRRATLVVRVPQEHFHSFLHELESTSSKVLNKSTYGQDVTEEFVDLQSRLSSKEIVEERLLAFLEEAENTEDLLEISRDLGEVQQEIERVKGRMDYLENHVALSTVTIQIYERAVNVPGIQDRESLNTMQHAQSLFMDTINVLITMFSRLFVFLVGLSPVILPIAIAGIVIYFVQKRRRGERKVNESTSKEQEKKD